MILYVNNRNEIKDVNTTTDTSLTPLEVSDENNPFTSWSVAKICCYKVEVKDGNITMYTPYVPYTIVEQLDRQGHENINLQSQVDYIAMMADIEL